MAVYEKSCPHAAVYDYDQVSAEKNHVSYSSIPPGFLRHRPVNRTSSPKRHVVRLLAEEHRLLLFCILRVKGMCPTVFCLDKLVLFLRKPYGFLWFCFLLTIYFVLTFLPGSLHMLPYCFHSCSCAPLSFRFPGTFPCSFPLPFHPDSR